MVIEKTCTRCGKTQPADTEHFPWVKSKNRLDSWCRQCYRDNSSRYAAIDPEAKRERDRLWRDGQGESYNQRRRERRAQRPISEKERAKIKARRHNEKLKREALEHYGGAFCHCCGETELSMLALDHIENDGASHRKSLTGVTRKMPMQSFIWAKKNGWPPIYQVSCFNCNWARHWNNGVCPHKEQIRWDNIALKSQQSVDTAANETSAKGEPWETAVVLPAPTAPLADSLRI